VFFLKELPTQQMLQSYRARFSEMDTDAIDAALLLLRRASLLMRELDAYFAARGTSQTRFLTMIVIDREAEQVGLLASEIADRLDVSRPVVTDTIKALERDGLLGSTRDDADGRAKRLALTREGSAALTGLLPGYFALIADFMAKDMQNDP
jgi:DNA-binding MarR family transcriptional regulator